MHCIQKPARSFYQSLRFGVSVRSIGLGNGIYLDHIPDVPGRLLIGLQIQRSPARCVEFLNSLPPGRYLFRALLVKRVRNRDAFGFSGQFLDRRYFQDAVQI